MIDVLPSGREMGGDLAAEIIPSFLTNEETEVLMEKKGPVHKLKLGEIALTIWDRKQNGSTSYNVEVFREQKGPDGKWVQSHDFSPQEEPLKARLEQYALNWLLKHQTVKQMPNSN